MRRRVFRPWRNLEELHEVELLLYNDEAVRDSFPDESSTRRDRGIAHVETWRERGPVPHAIVSTASLVSAAQFHENHVELGTAATKTLEIRASYSHAFARFVTGFCDIQQSSTSRKTMYEMAKLIHLPETFVTLRHRIVHHQKPPSLKTLELSTAVALSWLRTHFWKRIHNPDKLPLEENVEEPKEEVAHQSQVILKQYLKARKNEIRDGKPSDEDESTAAHVATGSLLMLCHVQVGSLNYAASFLVGDNLIFPIQRQGTPNMRGAYEIWDPLLKEMFYRTQQKFAYCLINRLNKILIEFPLIREVHDSKRRMAVEWLCHLLEPESSGMCHGTFLTEQRDNVMENCFLYPNYWNSQLAVKLIDGAGPHFQRKWRSFLGGAAEDDGSNVESDLSDGPDFSINGSVVRSLPSEVGGWSRVESWTPTRIGSRWT